jgi:hypothetical protein
MQKGTVAYSVRKGVAALLQELDLTDRYAAPFESAGYDDAMLMEVAEAVDEV